MVAEFALLIGPGLSLLLPIDRVPGHGGPIDVPHHHPAAWAKHSVHFSERRRHVAHILEDLNADRPLEAGIWDRERGRVRFMELDVAVPGEGEFVRHPRT